MSPPPTENTQTVAPDTEPWERGRFLFFSFAPPPTPAPPTPACTCRHRRSLVPYIPPAAVNGGRVVAVDSIPKTHNTVRLLCRLSHFLSIQRTRVAATRRNHGTMTTRGSMNTLYLLCENRGENIKNDDNYIHVI